MIPPCPIKTVASFLSAPMSCLVAAMAFAALPAAASDAGVSIIDTGGQATCTNVQALLKSRTIVDCPDGEVYTFCFTREAIDLSGLLDGTLHYFSDPTYADRSQIGWDESQNVYYGILKWVTAAGELTTREVGIWDNTTKNYVGLGTVTGGTGRFADATGSLVSRGNGGGGGGSTGTICLN